MMLNNLKEISAINPVYTDQRKSAVQRIKNLLIKISEEPIIL